MAGTFDAIVVGTGQAGPALAMRLADAGMTVAVVERQRFGGTCLNYGCTPTKSMVASARVAHMARRAADFGVRVCGEVSVDMRAVKARTADILRPSREGIEARLRQADRIAVHEGHGRFAGPRRIEVNGHTLESARIFLDVGARPAIPPIAGIETTPYLTNADMVELDELPRHLVIVGGGYVAIEFAQMFRRFGSAVTVLQRGPRVLETEDVEVSEAVRTILEEEGVAVATDVQVREVGRADGGVWAAGMQEVEPATVDGSHLLIAAGRRPNTDDLRLDAAGIETDEKGYIRVDDALRTSADGVWALGDCNGRGAFTHTAYNDFEIVAANLLGNEARSVADRIPAYAVFTDPPLARVGMTEAEVRRSGRRALVGRMAMEDVSRAKEKGETRGFMKVLVDADTGLLLGASLLGTGCDEAVHAIVDTMYADAPCSTLARAVHIHPTVAELIPTLLKQLAPLT